MQVREIMSSKLDTIPPQASLAEVARKMREDDVGALPVVENDRLVGMITDRDIVVRSVADGRDVNSTTARDAMSPELVYCQEDHSVEEVSSKMAKAQVRRMPVLDANDRLVGIVSLGDLSRNEPSSSAGEALRAVSEPTPEARA